MISNAQFEKQDAEILAIFARTSSTGAAAPSSAPHAGDAGDSARIERIVEKARYEAVVKDSASFLFRTLGVGVGGLAKAAFGALAPEGEAEKPGLRESERDKKP